MAEDFNSKGGLNIGGEKYLIEIVEADTKYTAEGATSAARRLVEQHKVHMVMGALATHVTLGMQEVTEKAKIIALSTAADDMIIKKNEGKKYTFRAYISYTELHPGMFKWLANTYPDKKKLMILDPNLSSSWHGHKLIKKAAPKFGFEIVYDEFYEDGTKDFYPFFVKAMGKKPDIFFNNASPPADWALHIKQTRELGFKGVFIENHVIAIETMAPIAGKANLEGVYGVGYPEDIEDYQKYKEAYAQKYGGWNPVGAYMPGPLSVILHAFEKAGSLDSDKVADVLESGKMLNNFSGLQGVFGGKNFYGRNAQWLSKQLIYQVTDTKLLPVGEITVDDMLHGWD